MGIFKKEKANPDKKRNELLFKEAVKEINELYDDLKSEYSNTETAITEFSEFIEEIKGRLDAGEIARMEDFALRLKQVNSSARNSVRDIRDILRNHRKRLNEVSRG